jgi:predicted DNA-binding transcriptional regulator AlpA
MKKPTPLWRASARTVGVLNTPNLVPINAFAKWRRPLKPEESSMPKSRTQFAAVLPRPPTPRLALSIPEFCEAHGISEGFFYKLKKQGEGPREMKVGARTLITFESAAEWRRTRENRKCRSISPDSV